MIIQSGTIRRSKYAISDLNKIERIMANAAICRLGLVDHGQAYIVPMNFGYADGTLYFHGSAQGRKMDLIRANPRVSFEIESQHELIVKEQACGFDMHYACIMGTGIATEIINAEKKKKALAVLMNHYLKKVWTFPEEKVVKTTLIQVKIETLSAKSNRHEYLRSSD